MFDKLKKSFEEFVELIKGNRITEKDVINYFETNKYELLETDLSLEVIDHIESTMIEKVRSGQFDKVDDRKSAVILALRNSISEMFPEPINIENAIMDNNIPFIITFLGIC